MQLDEKYHEKYAGCDAFLAMYSAFQSDKSVAAIRKNLILSIDTKSLNALYFYVCELYRSGARTNEAFAEIEEAEIIVRTN
jgi:hypothetical protein